MVVSSVTETDLNAGTALLLQAGAPPTTFQGPRHFCTASLQYSIFKPLTYMLHLSG